MTIDTFARNLAKNVILSTYRRRLSELMASVKPNQIEWLIQNNKNFVDFMTQVNLPPEEKGRFTNVARVISNDELFNSLQQIRPDLAQVILKNNARPWFDRQMRLFKERLL